VNTEEIANTMQAHINAYNKPGGPSAGHTIERIEGLIGELRTADVPEPSWQDMPTVTDQDKIAMHLRLTQQGGAAHTRQHLAGVHHFSYAELADRTFDDLLRKHAELHEATPPLAEPGKPMVSCSNGEHPDGIHQLTYACRAPKFAKHPQGEL
jgi:hypothetical protein